MVEVSGPHLFGDHGLAEPLRKVHVRSLAYAHAQRAGGALMPTRTLPPLCACTRKCMHIRQRPHMRLPQRLSQSMVPKRMWNADFHNPDLAYMSFIFCL